MQTPPPQQPPQNPSPQPSPGAPYAPPTGPTIRFDVIGQAFNMVFADLGTWAVAALCVFIVLAAVYAVFFIFLFASLFHGGFFLLLFGELILIALVVTVVNVMMANMYRMAIMALSGIKPNVNEMFKFGSNSGNVIVASLIVGLAVAIGSIFCYIPGLILGGLFMFTLPIVVDRNLSPTDAINLSVATLKKDIVMAAIFYLVVSFCAGIGSVAIGIGIILTLPVMPIAIAMLYRDYLGFASQNPT